MGASTSYEDLGKTWSVSKNMYIEDYNEMMERRRNAPSEPKPPARPARPADEDFNPKKHQKQLQVINQAADDLVSGFLRPHRVKGQWLSELTSIVHGYYFSLLQTPLHTACYYGFSRAVSSLCRIPRINAKERLKSDGASPLFIACREGHSDCAKVILSDERWFDRDSPQTNDGETPLFVASNLGHTKIVELLMNNRRNCAIWVDYTDQYGQTALYAATEGNHSEIVSILLKDANVNRADTNGRTPLFVAAVRGYLEIVKMLLEHLHIEKPMTASKYIDHSDKTGMNALWAVSMALMNDIKFTATSNSLAVVHLLLENGADANKARDDGCTPLWVAASKGNTALMRLLIEHEADINKTEFSQRATPMFVAAQNGHSEAVELLVRSGADPNQPREIDGATPLMMAAQKGHSEIVDILLQYGADLTLANTLSGLNVMACAAMQGHCALLRVLYQKMMEQKSVEEVFEFINGGDTQNGWTPLMLASIGGHEEVVEFLVETVKVDVSKVDFGEKTARDHAAEGEFQALADWLDQRA